MRYARNIVRFAGLLGGDERSLLRTAAIDPVRLDDLDGWLEGDAINALWAAAVAETGDPDFGLRLGAQAQPGAISIVGYAMLSAATFGDALEVLVRFGPMIATVQAVRLERGGMGQPAVVEMVPHTTGPLALHLRQPLEASLSMLMTMARAVTGRELPTVGVEILHPRPPSGTETHEAVFGVRPAFGAGRYAVAFDAGALRWRSRAASPVLHASFVREGDRALRAMTGSVRARAAAAIEARFEGRVPALVEVAADLAMSERTLQRHLDDEGTSFQALCDDVRRGLAVRSLRDPGRTVQEVAALLGYSAPSAFHRAFRRWTGQTPGAFRRALTQMGVDGKG